MISIEKCFSQFTDESRVFISKTARYCSLRTYKIRRGFNLFIMILNNDSFISIIFAFLFLKIFYFRDIFIYLYYKSKHKCFDVNQLLQQFKSIIQSLIHHEMENTLKLNIYIQSDDTTSAISLVESMQTAELQIIKDNCESIKSNRRFKSQKAKHKLTINTKLTIVNTELEKRQK